MKTAKIAKLCVACLSIGLLASLAQAQYSTGFEPPEFSGSADGVPLNGQGGYYQGNPNYDSPNVYTYVDNPLGVPSNPTGDSQFVGLLDDNTRCTTYYQEGLYGDGTGDWVISFDMAADFVGDLPDNPMPGQFCNNPYGDYEVRSFRLVPTFMNEYGQPSDEWTLWLQAATEDGGQTPFFYCPFTNHIRGHWYNVSTHLSFETNEISSIEITDLETGGTEVWDIPGAYVYGGADSTLPLSNGIMVYAGGAACGNVLAIDNISITPEPGSLVLLALGACMVLRRR